MHESITEIAEWAVRGANAAGPATKPSGAEGDWLLEPAPPAAEAALPPADDFLAGGRPTVAATADADSDWTCAELRAARRRAALKAAEWREEIDSRTSALNRRLQATSTV